MNIDKEKVKKAKKEMMLNIQLLSNIDKKNELTKLYISTYNIIKNSLCFLHVLNLLSAYETNIKSFDNYNEDMTLVFDNIYMVIFKNMIGTEEEIALQETLKTKEQNNNEKTN